MTLTKFKVLWLTLAEFYTNNENYDTQRSFIWLISFSLLPKVTKRIHWLPCNKVLFRKNGLTFTVCLDQCQQCSDCFGLGRRALEELDVFV